VCVAKVAVLRLALHRRRRPLFGNLPFGPALSPTSALSRTEWQKKNVPTETISFSTKRQREREKEWSCSASASNDARRRPFRNYVENKAIAACSHADTEAVSHDVWPGKGDIEEALYLPLLRNALCDSKMHQENEAINWLRAKQHASKFFEECTWYEVDLYCIGRDGFASEGY